MELDVIVVGAGPAGIGCALAIRRAGVENLLVLEANEVGSSFRKWPEQMRLITPSFHGNPFFQTDLNAITPNTSPADFTQKEHLSGDQYAKYLKATVKHFALNVREKERVKEIRSESEGYSIETEHATFRSRIVVWAGGEFSNPKLGSFPGAEHCVHTSAFRDWNDYKNKEAIIIGGYESGVDAACNLIQQGKRVILLSSGEPWKVDDPDPSEVLSPYTRDRFLDTLRRHPGRLALRGNATVSRVSYLSKQYVVETAEGDVFDSKYRPISAIGFHSALEPIKEFWEWEGTIPKFTEEDESTLYSGIYYSGPSLIQRKTKFCFIYKFRARFGVIARSIVKRLGRPEPDFEDERRRGFLIDDLDCCTNCECAVDSEAEAISSSS
ncbi:MAG: NAD(P)/FAD-dependent oxidoreductase [Opitutales bacterium]